MEFFSALNACLKNLRGIYRLLWIIKLRYILSPNNFIHHRIVILGLAPSILIPRGKREMLGSSPSMTKAAVMSVYRRYIFEPATIYCLVLSRRIGSVIHWLNIQCHPAPYDALGQRRFAEMKDGGVVRQGINP